MMNLIFWGVVFVLGLVFEILTLQLVSIWFAVGAVGAFIAAMSGFSVQGQLAIFVLVSIVLLLATRPLLSKLRVKNAIRTNADHNIGNTAIVIEEINPSLSTGRARINGVDWIAVSETGDILPVDTVVMIVQVEGAKLIVRNADDFKDPLAHQFRG
ncbi:MAG TPA: NfeD family protein [Ruminococcus sp.]|nr:NfeD family protein [Ruminococcus sp.]